MGTFHCNRRDQHNPRRTFAAVVLLLGVDDPGIEVALELLQASGAFERFIETKEGDDHIRLAEGKVLIGRTEAIGARAQGHFIGGPAEIAHHEIELGEAPVEKGLEMVVPGGAHLGAGGVADDADVIVLVQFELRRLGGGHNGCGQGDEEKKQFHGKAGRERRLENEAQAVA